ncbi:MAG TPA: translocation/assembly module TamB domain-containing protein, partial [Hyphomonadaceae bacterium]|nr:translocation/assembly module TamB domain-containing protein [Hyphomonadaceae bacterium]
IQTGTFDFAGSSSFNRLSDLGPFAGSARGQWTAKRASHAAPIRVTADATGRDVSSSIAMISELAGPNPNVRLSGVVRDGRFTLESGAVRGDGVSAAMNGRISDTGAITAHATGSLIRPIDLPGARVRSLDFVADLSGGLSAPRAEIRLSNGAMTVASLDLDDIRGDAALKLGDKVSGNFSLTGASGKEPLIAAGRIESDTSGWRLAGVSGRLGDVQINAPMLGYAKGVFSANFEVDGRLAGLAGLDRGTLTAKGSLSTGNDTLKLDAQGRITDLRSGAMRVDLVSFEAKADSDTASLKSRIKATRGAPFDIALEANARHADQEWTGDATIDGTVDKQKVATSRPAAWRYGANGWSLDTQLAGLGGTLDAKLADLAGGASVKLDLANLDLKALTQLARISPINGTITGNASFSNGPGAAAGQAMLVLDKANPVGVTADPVSITIESQLQNGLLHTAATGSGQGFKLDAGSELHMRVGHGLNLTADRAAPLMAHVSLDGRAEQLWAVFGPEGQALRGEVTADVSVAGTLDKPALTGGFGMDKGAYEHGETGLHLVDISAKGQFDQRSATITSLVAHDPQGGELTGGGAINWDGDVSGGIKVKAVNLRALGRDDRSATVSGEGAVTLDKQAIRVTGAFDVAQARISIEQPASAMIPTLASVRRVNFATSDDEPPPTVDTPPWQRPIQLDLKVAAPRRVVVFGRGLDTEWSANFTVQGPIANPSLHGTASLVRGSIDLAGRRFDFDTGTIDLDGPIRDARIDISAKRTTTDIDASIHVTGTPDEPKFELESTPSLPQDEILARVLFGRSASQLSAFEAAQLAAGLAQLAGGQAGFDPAGLVRKATGLDRVALGGEGGIASVSAGKYVADNVYVQVGAGGVGGAAASVEWDPQKNLSVTSSAQANGDTKLSVRWKKDY